MREKKEGEQGRMAARKRTEEKGLNSLSDARMQEILEEVLKSITKWAKLEDTRVTNLINEYKREVPEYTTWTAQLTRRYKQAKWGESCRRRPNTAKDCEAKPSTRQKSRRNECAVTGWFPSVCRAVEKQWEDAAAAVDAIDLSPITRKHGTEVKQPPLLPFRGYIDDLVLAIQTIAPVKVSFGISVFPRADQQALTFRLLYGIYKCPRTGKLWKILAENAFGTFVGADETITARGPWSWRHAQVLSALADFYAPYVPPPTKEVPAARRAPSTGALKAAIKRAGLGLSLLYLTGQVAHAEATGTGEEGAVARYIPGTVAKTFTGTGSEIVTIAGKGEPSEGLILLQQQEADQVASRFIAYGNQNVERGLVTLRQIPQLLTDTFGTTVAATGILLNKLVIQPAIANLLVVKRANQLWVVENIYTKNNITANPEVIGDIQVALPSPVISMDKFWTAVQNATVAGFSAGGQESKAMLDFAGQNVWQEAAKVYEQAQTPQAKALAISEAFQTAATARLLGTFLNEISQRMAKVPLAPQEKPDTTAMVEQIQKESIRFETTSVDTIQLQNEALNLLNDVTAKPATLEVFQREVAGEGGFKTMKIAVLETANTMRDWAEKVDKTQLTNFLVNIQESQQNLTTEEAVSQAQMKILSDWAASRAVEAHIPNRWWEGMENITRNIVYGVVGAVALIMLMVRIIKSPAAVPATRAEREETRAESKEAKTPPATLPDEPRHVEPPRTVFITRVETEETFVKKLHGFVSQLKKEGLKTVARAAGVRVSDEMTVSAITEKLLDEKKNPWNEDARRRLLHDLDEHGALSAKDRWGANKFALAKWHQILSPEEQPYPG